MSLAGLKISFSMELLQRVMDAAARRPATRRGDALLEWARECVAAICLANRDWGMIEADMLTELIPYAADGGDNDPYVRWAGEMLRRGLAAAKQHAYRQAALVN